MDYKIKRSNRKTISIEVGSDAKVLVRAPRLAPKFMIQKFVQDNVDWIAKKKIKMKERQVQPKQFIPGEKFLFFGDEYDLEFVDGKGLDLDGSFKLGIESQSKAAEVFIKWYKQEFRKYLEDRVNEFSIDAGYGCQKIRLSSAKRRWGSCSSKKTLSFVWRLVMAPPEVIDYVIAHELAHIKHMNHSRAFWAEVERIMPGHDPYKKWLKDNGWKLTIE